MLIDVDLGNKRSSALPLEIREQELMLKGKLYIGLIPSTFPPITKVNMVDCQSFVGDTVGGDGNMKHS